MNVVEIGGVQVSVDPAPTRRAYQVLAVSADRCFCAYCRKFRALGTKAFPDAVLAFFMQAGIDPDQPAETYDCKATAPGKHLCGGEFYFFGKARLAEGSVLGPAGPFDFTFAKPSPLAQDAFRERGCMLQLHR